MNNKKDLQKEMDKRHKLLDIYEKQFIQFNKELKKLSVADNFRQEDLIQLMEKIDELQKLIDDTHIELNYLYVEQTTQGL